jgi:dTDP-glucose 4,6-dehydratase
MIAISYWRSYGVPLIITNTMNNYGEMQGASKYPVIIQKKLERGEKVEVHVSSDNQMGTRYYIHSRNVADAVLFILKNTTPYMHQPGEVDVPDRYNIVGTQQSNLELAQTIAKLMGKELDYELVDFHSTAPGHDLHYGLDGSKLEQLGWRAPVSFEESLSKTIKWQTENREWIDEANEQA